MHHPECPSAEKIAQDDRVPVVLVLLCQEIGAMDSELMSAL